MNDLLKNPFLVFIAGLLILYLVFMVLKVFINLFWLVILAFIILFFVNSKFRNTVRSFLNSLFNR